MVQGYSPQATRALLFRAYLDVNYSKLSKSGGHSAKGGWQKCADAHIIGEKISQIRVCGHILGERNSRLVSGCVSPVALLQKKGRRGSGGHWRRSA